jgi:hypothetical protein
LTQIEAEPGFACRARYDKPGAIPSEHAKGDAIDISSFVLTDNRRIRVMQQDSDIPWRAISYALCGQRPVASLPPSSAPGQIRLTKNICISTGMHGATPYYRICE